MEQITIFDLLAESKPLPSKINLLSLFSGIGAFEKALDNLGISYELVGYCEIDKYASKSYSAIHGVSEDMNLWDVTKVDEKALPKDIDLITYGFPCQDISLVGKQKGLFNEDGTKTRSGLFFDALRIIEETKPRVAIAENVKNLMGKKFKEQFQIVLSSLQEAGYNNYYQVLNAKDFGIPQNRERVFIVSIRKDIDKGMFEFPKGFPLEKRLKDVLEESVDEKYYLSDKGLAYITAPKRQNKYTQILNRESESTGCAITAVGNANWTGNFIEEPTINQVAQIYPNSGNPQAGRIYDADGISSTMDTCSGGNRMPKVIEPIVWDGYNQRIRADQSCVGTLTTMCGADLKRHGQGIIEHPLRIRKLTPLECFRLMGFDDADFHKAESVNSNTQLYKQAGNSIVVDVLEYLLKALFENL
jgi:DNA (cytosine-5)-methyltransferase 1